VSVEFQSVRKLLIVEDEPDIATSLRLLLTHSCVAIEVAVNGIEAIQKARDLRPDVILLDVLLPVMDGFEVFRTLRAEPDFGRTRVIFLSAHAQPGALALAKELGAYDTIGKPFRASQLRNKVLLALGIDDEEKNLEDTPAPVRRLAAQVRPPYVALVDDDPVIVEAIREMVRGALGASVVLSHHRFGMAALRDFASARPDLILLDFKLPDIDGLSLMRLLRKDDVLREIPVILITGVARTPQTIRALEAGADAYLFKPLEYDLFVATVRQVHQGRGAATAVKSDRH
jgi:CheY-like chemotaxis protein